MRATVELQKAKECFDFNLDFWFLECAAEFVAELESLLINCLGPSANQISGAIQVKINAVPRRL